MFSGGSKGKTEKKWVEMKCWWAETGLIDHHLVVYTMLKYTYAKFEPKILWNRSYKDFNKESFFQDLQYGLNNISKFAEFNDEFKAILNHHAHIK